jgi:hypothetical protein
MNIFEQNQLFWKRHPLVMGVIGLGYVLVFGMVIATYIILSPRHVGPGIFKVINGPQASSQVSDDSGDSIIRSAVAQDSVPAQVKVKKPAPRATPELVKTVMNLQWAPPGSIIDAGEGMHTASNDYQNLPPGQYDVAAAPAVDIDRELARLASR